MRPKFLFLFLFILPLWTSAALNTELEQHLKQLGFDSIRPIEFKSQRYEAAYELFFDQAVDHSNPSGQHFKQRIILRHRGFDRPTVMVTEGYAADYALWPSYDEEIAVALDANLVVVEHRYFGKSRTEPIQWKQLNLQNATADLHHVNQTLKAIYPKAWVSTGISKGGQTALYYRYFYPDDVAASVPYVAPLNFSVADKRVYHFKDTVATAPCREKLLALQKDVLNRRNIFLPMFADSTQKRGMTFNKVGSIEMAFEYNVLEWGFAYWQWFPMACDKLPEPGGDANEIFKAFIAAAGYDFFEDESILGMQPFFYQALTEMGFYSYETKSFGQLLHLVDKPSFRHTLPEGVEARYHPGLSRKVNRWLKKAGNNILYVYGGYDAWASTAVQPGYKTNALKLVLPGGSHATRLRHFDSETREKALQTLKTWVGYEPADSTP